MRSELISLVLASIRPVDRLALATLFELWPTCTLLAAEETLDGAALQCRSLAPDALLLDLGFPAEEVFDLAARMTGEGTVRAVGVLDVEFAFLHAKRTLAIPRAAYFTRFDPFEHICQELTSMVLGAGATPAEQRPEQTPHLPASNDDDRPLALLSGREEELFLLLAQGLSVRQSAERMGLAASTVDNHKWRLMKKLCVRRTSQLTRLAMRAGLIE